MRHRDPRDDPPAKRRPEAYRGPPVGKPGRCAMALTIEERIAPMAYDAWTSVRRAKVGSLTARSTRMTPSDQAAKEILP